MSTNSHSAGFVRSPVQSQDAKDRIEAVQEKQFQAPARKIIPQGNILKPEPKPEEKVWLVPVEVAKDLQVRHVDKVGGTTEKERKASRIPSQSGKKNSDNKLGLRDAMYRRIDQAEPEIHYLGIPSESRMKDAEKHDNTSRIAYLHVEQRFNKKSHNLPGIIDSLHVPGGQGFDGVSKAFMMASALKDSNSRVDAPIVGVVVRKLSPESQERIEGIGWALYDSGGFPLDPDLYSSIIPTFTPKGIDKVRYEANAVGNALMAEKIGKAIYSEGENQYKHFPKIVEIAQCNRNGMIVATGMAAERIDPKKIKKEVEDKFQVIVTWKSGIVELQAVKVEGKTHGSFGEHEEAVRAIQNHWLETESQAVSFAMECMLEAKIASVKIVAANSEKGLDPSKYMPGAWIVSRDEAILTRSGFMLLQGELPSEPIKNVPNRWINRTHAHKGPWMKAKSDRSSFSKG